MKAITVLAALTTLLSSAAAQATYEIDPNSVPLSTRQFWCESQTSQCPLICLQTSAHSAETEANDCDSTMLTFACVCSNGMSPNVSQYSQTLPFFTCQEWGNQCVSNCGSDNSCASACRDNHPCGALDPKRVNVTSTTSTSSAAASGSAAASTNSQGVVFTGFGDGSGAKSTGSPDSDSSSAAAPRLQYGQTFGLVGLVAGFFLGFALVL